MNTYPGGKGGCYQQIINIIPPHKTFISTHMGNCAVLRHIQPAERTIGIDINPDIIKGWQGRIKYQQPGITFICGDARSTLENMTLTGNEFVYLDPPYLMHTRKGGSLYKFEYSDQQHEELLDFILTLSCPAAISGYDSEMYRDKLSHWSHKSFRVGTRGSAAIEHLWFNYKTPHIIHDYRYAGDNFRQREKHTRKRNRWANKFKNLGKAERYSIYKTLSHIIAQDGDTSGRVELITGGQGY